MHFFHLVFDGLVLSTVFNWLAWSQLTSICLVWKRVSSHFSAFLSLGYTDGICPIDNHRYFQCPDGRGYYVLKTNVIQSYQIVSHNSSLSTSNSSASKVPQPTASASSPIAARTQSSSDTTRPASLNRGFLSRLASEREDRKARESSASSEAPGSDPPSRIYRAENYRSVSWEADRDPSTSQEDLRRRNMARSELIDNTALPSYRGQLPPFGQEYFLDHWTLVQVVSLLEIGIPFDNQFCLNSHDDQCSVQMLVDEQINASASFIPEKPPKDIRIELIKVFEHVKSIFPSRAIRLHDNDYLLLAILCSNDQCAYIRTTIGWAYTDDDNERGSSLQVDEISQMIDGERSDIRQVSEQCQHLLKNAAFLYYKLVD